MIRNLEAGNRMPDASYQTPDAGHQISAIGRWTPDAGRQKKAEQ